MKATDEQLADDWNGILSVLQKKMLRTMLTHINELGRHIKELDDEIDRNMKDEEKIAALIAIYHILKDNVPFRDLGAEYYNQFNRERKINAYLKS